jgi:hypothetical protein
MLHIVWLRAKGSESWVFLAVQGRHIQQQQPKMSVFAKIGLLKFLFYLIAPKAP